MPLPAQACSPLHQSGHTPPANGAQLKSRALLHEAVASRGRTNDARPGAHRLLCAHKEITVGVGCDGVHALPRELSQVAVERELVMQDLIRLQGHYPAVM